LRLEGLERGVAGASVLAKANAVTLKVVDLGVNGQVSPGDVVVVPDAKLLHGTRNFCLRPAMTTEESEACIRAG
jgi:NaMN:DMB phosphoribosyltransferase